MSNKSPRLRNTSADVATGQVGAALRIVARPVSGRLAGRVGTSRDVSWRSGASAPGDGTFRHATCPGRCLTGTGHCVTPKHRFGHMTAGTSATRRNLHF